MNLSYNVVLAAADMTTLGMLFATGALPELDSVHLAGSSIGDDGMKALCEGIGKGVPLRLDQLGLQGCGFGLAGAEALAAATGAAPCLAQGLYIDGNAVGDKGMAKLAAHIRQRPDVGSLGLSEVGITDEGVTALVADLGERELKQLFSVNLPRITEKGRDVLVAALDGNQLPAIMDVSLAGTDSACRDAVLEVVRRSRERHGIPDSEESYSDWGSSEYDSEHGSDEEVDGS